MAHDRWSEAKDRGGAPGRRRIMGLVLWVAVACLGSLLGLPADGSLIAMTPAGWLVPAARAQEQVPPPALQVQDQAPSAAVSDPQQTLPPAQEILEQAIQAAGGRGALEKIHTRVTHGTLEVPAMGIKATMITYAAEPNKVYSLAESDAIGRLESGSDGEVFWESTMMTGPRIKEGEEKATVARESRFHGDLEWQQLYKQASTVAVTSVGGRDCYKLAMVPADGQVEYHYIDVENYLLRKIESMIQGEMGEIKVESFPDDYREVDGIVMSFRTRQVLTGVQELHHTIERVEHNVAIPDSVFALPDEVRALLAPAEAQPTK